MIGKTVKLSIVSFLVVLVFNQNVFGQDEGSLPIKEEAEEVQPDTLSSSNGSDVEFKTLTSGDLVPNTEQKTSQVLIIPAKPVPNSNSSSLQEDKPKVKDTKRESSFNIFHYLIYKFRSEEDLNK